MISRRWAERGAGFHVSVLTYTCTVPPVQLGGRLGFLLFLFGFDFFDGWLVLLFGQEIYYPRLGLDSGGNLP